MVAFNIFQESSEINPKKFLFCRSLLFARVKNVKMFTCVVKCSFTINVLDNN